MSKLGADLQYGTIWHEHGTTWQVGAKSGSIWLEASSQDDLERDELTPGVFQKEIAVAAAQQPGLTVSDDGAVRVEISRGGVLRHYVVRDLRLPPELIL